MSCPGSAERGEPRHFCLCICECENEATTEQGFCAACQHAVDHATGQNRDSTPNGGRDDAD